MRRIGMLMPGDENDSVFKFKPRLSAFTQALADSGWTDGRNVRMGIRWGGVDSQSPVADVAWTEAGPCSH